MTAQTTGWLSAWLSRPWPGGLFFVGGCGADGVPFSQALTQDSAVQVNQQSWVTLNEAVAQLAAYGCENANSVWTFETAVMWVARRSDGAWAGVFAPRELPEGIKSAAKSRLVEFVSAAD